MKPTQISNTAAFIAIKFYGLTREQAFRALFEDDVITFYEKVVQNLPLPLRFYNNLLKKSWLRTFFIYWEELLLPGDLMHILMRKLYLQKMVTQMIKKGYNQLIVIGAGFDHLAALHSQKGVKAVEFDANRMAHLKRDFLIKNDYKNPNLHVCDAFISKDSLQQMMLGNTQLHPKEKTIIVAEGFFDYLDPQLASTIMQEITDFFEGPVTLLTTLFSLEELSRLQSFVYDTSIKLAGEQLRLHVDKSQFFHLLQQWGFSVDKCINTCEMKKDILQPRHITMPILSGFYILQTHYENNE